MPEVIGLDLLHAWRDGRVKQAVIAAGLRLRRDEPAVFATGDYRAVAAEGSRAENIVGIERRLGDTSVVCVVPRLSRTLAGPGQFPVGDCWEETAVELPGRYVNVLTGQAASGVRPMSELLSTLPVALLVR